jgi:hypothetical protein
MKIINGFVRGPFKNEREFKQAVLKSWGRCWPGYTFFEIENEEKEPGMPDVLAVSSFLPACFTEFKYADKRGIIEFQKSQPHFYRRHSGLLIQILAWDCRMGGRMVCLESSEASDAKALRILLPLDISAVINYKPGDICL